MATVTSVDRGNLTRFYTLELKEEHHLGYYGLSLQAGERLTTHIVKGVDSDWNFDYAMVGTGNHNETTRVPGSIAKIIKAWDKQYIQIENQIVVFNSENKN